MWNQVHGLTRVGSQLWRTLSGSDKLFLSVNKASPSELPLTTVKIKVNATVRLVHSHACAAMVGDSGDSDFSSSALRERGIKFLGFGWERESVCVCGKRRIGFGNNRAKHGESVSYFTLFFFFQFTFYCFFYIYKMSFKFSQNYN